MDVVEPRDPGLLDDRERRLPIVVPRDVVEIGRARFPEVLAHQRHEKLAVEPPLRRDVRVGCQIAAQDRGTRPQPPGRLEKFEI